MPLDPETAVGVVAAWAVGSGGTVFSQLPRASAPPSGWPGDEVFFVDASAATARAAGGEASLVKLAVLHRRPGSGGWERLYAPVVPGAKAPPVLYAPGGERVRQALVYVVELASLLALAKAPSIEGEPLGDRRILVRHGPLVQQLAHYYSPVYDVELATAEAALRYAGLDSATASQLVSRSMPRGSPGSVNLGFLMGLLLDSIAWEARSSNGKLLFAGVVEDTSRSRVLVADLLAEATLAVAHHYRPQTPHDLGSALAGMVNSWVAGYPGRHGFSLSSCLCGASPPSPSPATAAGEYVAPLESELRTRFNTGLLQAQALPGPSVVAAALASSGALPDMADSELLYNLVYLEDCSALGGSPCCCTAPRSRGAAAEWAHLSLGQRRSRIPTVTSLSQLADAPRLVRYTYMLVEKPPGCLDLIQLAKRLGVSVSVCDLTDFIHVPPAIRVEWMAPVDSATLERLLHALLWASKLVAYAYPSQLLVVDQASRVTFAEYRGLELLAEELAKRRQPYRGFLRGWRSRRPLAWPTP